ncbi:ROK family protein, partial [Providencia sp. PROV112]
MRIGIDLGGTKIEVIALDDSGNTLFRKRIPTPRGDYDATLKAIASLVADAETATGLSGSVGVGIPGTLSPVTGKVKNANSTWLNGK